MTLTIDATDAPLGAIVRGFDPTGSAAAETVGALLDALTSHGVLVFRGQAIDAAAPVAIGRAFGELEILPEPEKRHPDHPEIFNLSNVRADESVTPFEDPQAVFLRGTQRWHTDSSFREIPCLCTMLYAVEVPEQGGNTQFADMRAAYRSLPSDQQQAIEGVKLVHSYEYSRANNPGHVEPMTEAERAKYPPVTHPWARTNADHSRSLYMGGHVSHVADMPVAQGRAWVADVLDTVMSHDIVYEHQWQADDLVVWDNRTTLHRLMPYDIANDRRVMRRVTVSGTEPVR